MSPETQHPDRIFQNLGATPPRITPIGSKAQPVQRPGFSSSPDGRMIFNYSTAYGDGNEAQTPSQISGESLPSDPTTAMRIENPINGTRNTGNGGPTSPRRQQEKPIVITSNPHHRFSARALSPIETTLSQEIRHLIVSSLGGTLKEIKADTEGRVLAVIIDYNPNAENKPDNPKLVEKIVEEVANRSAKVIILVEDEDQVDEVQSSFAPPPDVFPAEASLPIAQIQTALNAQLLTRAVTKDI